MDGSLWETPHVALLFSICTLYSNKKRMEQKAVLGRGGKGMVTGAAGAAAGTGSCWECQGRLEMPNIPLGALGRGLCITGKHHSSTLISESSPWSWGREGDQGPEWKLGDGLGGP